MTILDHQDDGSGIHHLSGLGRADRERGKPAG
jgi:hypothetical protein